MVRIGRNSLVTTVLLIASVLTMNGCAIAPGQQKPVVVPEIGSHTADLSPRQTIDIMRAAGFTDSEIQRLGLHVRNALALKGAARVKRESQTDAIFVAHDGMIHVASWRRGDFMYEVATGEIR